MGSDFQWSDISVKVNEGYAVKDFGLVDGRQLELNNTGITPKELLNQLPSELMGTTATFYSGFTDNNKTYTKEMGVKWILDEEEYIKRYGNDSYKKMNEELSPRDKVYLVMERPGNEYFTGRLIYPRLIITIVGRNPNPSGGGGGSSGGNKPVIPAGRYKYITNYNQATDQYYALPGQTYEDISLPKTVEVDYYENDGTMKKETVKIDWAYMSPSESE